jgi:hypothetical protein
VLGLGGFSPALAAAWSFSRGIPTTYRAFATGAAATHLWRRTHRSRRLFEEHPALAAVADLVEAIWDWDIPDGDAAAAFTIKVPVPVANSI